MGLDFQGCSTLVETSANECSHLNTLIIVGWIDATHGVPKDWDHRPMDVWSLDAAKDTENFKVQFVSVIPRVWFSVLQQRPHHSPAQIWPSFVRPPTAQSANNKSEMLAATSMAIENLCAAPCFFRSGRCDAARSLCWETSGILLGRTRNQRSCTASMS